MIGALALEFKLLEKDTIQSLEMPLSRYPGQTNGALVFEVKIQVIPKL